MQKSRWRPVVRASFFGLVAATACSMAWFGVAAFSSFELFLLAIAVGMVIGLAVRAGSGNVGGRVYQCLAMALTYVAIMGAYVPVVVDGLQQPNPVPRKADAAASEEARSPVGPHCHLDQTMSEPAEEALSTTEAVMLAIPLALASPFFLAFSDVNNFLIAFLVLGLALREAWKANSP